MDEELSEDLSKLLANLGPGDHIIEITEDALSSLAPGMPIPEGQMVEGHIVDGQLVPSSVVEGQVVPSSVVEGNIQNQGLDEEFEIVKDQKVEREIIEDGRLIEIVTTDPGVGREVICRTMKEKLPPEPKPPKPPKPPKLIKLPEPSKEVVNNEKKPAKSPKTVVKRPRRKPPIQTTNATIVPIKNLFPTTDTNSQGDAPSQQDETNPRPDALAQQDENYPQSDALVQQDETYPASDALVQKDESDDKNITDQSQRDSTHRKQVVDDIQFISSQDLEGPSSIPATDNSDQFPVESSEKHSLETPTSSSAFLVANPSSSSHDKTSKVKDQSLVSTGNQSVVGSIPSSSLDNTSSTSTVTSSTSAVTSSTCVVTSSNISSTSTVALTKTMVTSVLSSVASSAIVTSPVITSSTKTGNITPLETITPSDSILKANVESALELLDLDILKSAKEKGYLTIVNTVGSNVKPVVANSQWTAMPKVTPAVSTSVCSRVGDVPMTNPVSAIHKSTPPVTPNINVAKPNPVSTIHKSTPPATPNINVAKPNPVSTIQKSTPPATPNINVAKPNPVSTIQKSTPPTTPKISSTPVTPQTMEKYRKVLTPELMKSILSFQSPLDAPGPRIYKLPDGTQIKVNFGTVMKKKKPRVRKRTYVSKKKKLEEQMSESERAKKALEKLLPESRKRRPTETAIFFKNKEEENRLKGIVPTEKEKGNSNERKQKEGNETTETKQQTKCKETDTGDETVKAKKGSKKTRATTLGKRQPAKTASFFKNKEEENRLRGIVPTEEEKRNHNESIIGGQKDGNETTETKQQTKGNETDTGDETEVNQAETDASESISMMTAQPKKNEAEPEVPDETKGNQCNDRIKKAIQSFIEKKGCTERNPIHVDDDADSSQPLHDGMDCVAGTSENNQNATDNVDPNNPKLLFGTDESEKNARDKIILRNKDNLYDKFEVRQARKRIRDRRHPLGRDGVCPEEPFPGDMIGVYKNKDEFMSLIVRCPTCTCYHCPLCNQTGPRNKFKPARFRGREIMRHIDKKHWDSHVSLVHNEQECFTVVCRLKHQGITKKHLHCPCGKTVIKEQMKRRFLLHRKTVCPLTKLIHVRFKPSKPSPPSCMLTHVAENQHRSIFDSYEDLMSSGVKCNSCSKYHCILCPPQAIRAQNNQAALDKHLKLHYRDRVFLPGREVPFFIGCKQLHSDITKRHFHCLCGRIIKSLKRTFLIHIKKCPYVINPTGSRDNYTNMNMIKPNAYSMHYITPIQVRSMIPRNSMPIYGRIGEKIAPPPLAMSVFENLQELCSVIKRCYMCCTQYHCPLCRDELYQPSSRRALAKHLLQQHYKFRVKLPSGQLSFPCCLIHDTKKLVTTKHYHCVCGFTQPKKNRFVKHMRGCKHSQTRILNPAIEHLQDYLVPETQLHHLGGQGFPNSHIDQVSMEEIYEVSSSEEETEPRKMKNPVPPKISEEGKTVPDHNEYCQKEDFWEETLEEHLKAKEKLKEMQVEEHHVNDDDDDDDGCHVYFGPFEAEDVDQEILDKKKYRAIQHNLINTYQSNAGMGILNPFDMLVSQLSQCTECCELYHCPWCPSDSFVPSTYKNALKHLKTHWTRRVLMVDGTFALPCRHEHDMCLSKHYHCMCSEVVEAASHVFYKHVKDCPYMINFVEDCKFSKIINEPMPPREKLYKSPTKSKLDAVVDQLENHINAPEDSKQVKPKRKRNRKRPAKKPVASSDEENSKAVNSIAFETNDLVISEDGQSLRKRRRRNYESDPDYEPEIEESHDLYSNNTVSQNIIVDNVASDHIFQDGVSYDIVLPSDGVIDINTIQNMLPSGSSFVIVDS